MEREGYKIEIEPEAGKRIFDSPNFDESEFAQAELLPRLKKIQGMCAERGIPLLFVIDIKRSEEGGESVAGVISPGVRCSPRMRLFETLVENEAAVERLGALAAMANLACMLTKGRPAK